MNVEKKLDEIIKKLNKIEEKVSKTDSKIVVVSESSDLLDANFTYKRKEINTILNTKADIDLSKQLNEKTKSFKEFQLNYEKALLMKESYDKRLNILIHGIKQNSDNVSEKREKTIEKFPNFFEEWFKNIKSK